MQKLGFYIIAPNETKAEIKERVKKRIDAYEGTKDTWFKEWFLSALDNMETKALSWESILDLVSSLDSTFREYLGDLYSKCGNFNWPSKNSINEMNYLAASSGLSDTKGSFNPISDSRRN